MDQGRCSRTQGVRPAEDAGTKDRSFAEADRRCNSPEGFHDGHVARLTRLITSRLLNRVFAVFCPYGGERRTPFRFLAAHLSSLRELDYKQALRCNRRIGNGGNVLRIAASIIVGLLAFAPITSEAFPIGANMGADQNPNVVESAGRCGPHAHYVRGHRTRSGHWVRGHCVRFRHR